MRNRKRWAWLAILLVIPFLTLATTSASQARRACTEAPYLAGSGTATGTRLLGSWSAHYNPDCAGSTDADIFVSWHSYFRSDGDLMVSTDASISTGAIAFNDCVQIALDWDGETSWQDHEDTQIMRNCKENSTRAMAEQTVDIDEHCGVLPNCHRNNWPVNRLQISVFDTGDQSIRREVCLGGSLAPATNTGDECWGGSDGNGGWNPNGAFSTTAAKIRAKWNDGSDDQNDPLWSGINTGLYRVNELVDPNN